MRASGNVPCSWIANDCLIAVTAIEFDLPIRIATATSFELQRWSLPRGLSSRSLLPERSAVL
jgi:hypothetical protein